MLKINTIYSFKKSNTRLLIALLVGIILLVGYFITSNYFLWIQKSKEEVLHRLMAITTTAALAIDGDAHERISNQFMQKDEIVTHEQDSDYLKLHKQLLNIKQANNIGTSIYTIVYYNHDSTFHFIGTSSEKPYFRHSYKNYPKALLTNQETGGVLDTYEDENGKWLSAFAPIKNKKGEVVGLIEIDENFEWFIEKAKKELIKNSLLSLLLIIPFGFLLYNFFSRTLKKQENDQALLVLQKEEIEAQNEEIITQSDFIEKQNQELDLRVRARTQELESANAELANFLYHSSHDVQAPIATLKGLQSLALLEAKDENSKMYLNLLSETTTKLESMVKTIQLVHHLKTKKIEWEEIDLEEMIQTVYQSINNHKNCILQLDLMHSKVTGDPELLKGALHELFKNSLQYNDGKENLIIKTISKINSDSVTLVIQDNGIGIMDEAKAELFTMFKRGNENSTGIGLGLYIAQTALARMGGTIKVFDATYTGAAFHISMPLIN